VIEARAFDDVSFPFLILHTTNSKVLFLDVLFLLLSFTKQILRSRPSLRFNSSWSLNQKQIKNHKNVCVASSTQEANQEALPNCNSTNKSTPTCHTTSKQIAKQTNPYSKQKTTNLMHKKN
jgi:hypothetical protein